MKLKQDWCVFISQTGTEVIDIAREVNCLPGLIVTNNLKKVPKANLDFFELHGVSIQTVPFRTAAIDLLKPEFLNKSLITLHGFLRIIPAMFLDAYKGKIYNGHPGLITKYEELKGKDPQVRAWEGNYPEVGSVVHKVTAGVDEGEVLAYTSTKNTAKSLNEMYNLLRGTSLEVWTSFLKELDV